ncbi:DNA-methyltransferase [Methanococcus maripaludis]|uniref:Type II methyltransferase n=1 Tax=Methanococcus maripaludis TaxID=39152 RepID=A0A7J9PL94_METMI|nr:DNA methyltransferase [Methanococcus maripaludis]MBA2863985.1 site-specific DNA-methyltransferase (adenine-specific) [Methanococcus maripaludis]
MILPNLENCDCLQVMEQLPDNFFDLCITDPPYGIGESKKSNNCRSNLASSTTHNKKDWDSTIPGKKYFEEILRVSKNQIIFGGNYFLEYLKNTSCFIVWDKDNTGDFADAELAWTSFDTAVRVFKYRWNGMIQEDMRFKEQRYHPTQKPVALGRWLIQNYAKPGDTIFDPFAGSGAFLIAAEQLGYNWAGCEKEKEYCDIIQRRLKQSNLNMFFSRAAEKSL